MTGEIGMVDEDMVWEELAVVELEHGLGLLEVGVVTFVGIISLFSSSCDGRTRRC